MSAEKPECLAGLRYMNIDGVVIGSFSPDNEANEKPTEVHMRIECNGLPFPMIMRFKGTVSLDQIIDALTKHREDVFGKRGQ